MMSIARYNCYPKGTQVETGVDKVVIFVEVGRIVGGLGGIIVGVRGGV